MNLNDSIHKTIVRYNKSTRNWLAINDEARQFPAGPDGKTAALLVALQLDQNRIYRAVVEIILAHSGNEDIKSLIDRLLKGSQLLVRGYAYSNGRVKSQSIPDQTYDTSWDGIPASYHCTCPDHEHGLMKAAGQATHGAPMTAYGHLCKHSAAQLLAWLVDWPLEDEPIPFAPNHHNATAAEREAARIKAERDQERAKAWLAKYDKPGSQYNGFGGPKRDRDTALPASVDEHGRIEDWLG